jgi:hypothetical protein
LSVFILAPSDGHGILAGSTQSEAGSNNGRVVATLRWEEGQCQLYPIGYSAGAGDIFRHFHPTTPAWPIASTGSARANLLARLDLPFDIARMLEEETTYSLLMERLLSKPPPFLPQPPPPFREADHLDSPGLE